MMNVPSRHVVVNEGLGTKKTAFVIVTVIGCVAILWPKVFHPMMFGSAPGKPPVTGKENRLPGGCCDVVLDKDRFFNDTLVEDGPRLYRKQLNLFTGEISIRQERSPHLHPDVIHQSMKERGRAIPALPTIPIVEKAKSASNPPPRIVEGRPGPIPGMRPPLGAGSVHQAQPKTSSMGLIMPLYTIGIVVFFVYTLIKIVFKKPIPNAPYGPAPNDPTFRKEVFGQEKHFKDLNGSKLGSSQQQEQCRRIDCQAPSFRDTISYNGLQNAGQSPSSQLSNSNQLINKESEQLMEIEKLRKKLEETEKAMAKLIAEMNSDQYRTKETPDNTAASDNPTVENGHTDIADNKDKSLDELAESQSKTISNNVRAEPVNVKTENIKSEAIDRKRRDGSVDRTVAVLGMELTASCEGGMKWSGRPPTPVFLSHAEHSNEEPADSPEPQSIYLEGSLSHEAQILVADAETHTEEVFDKELNGSPEEPAVVLSSKMTLSLINLGTAEESHQQSEKTPPSDLESPLADDIEIIGHDEK